MPLSVCDHCDSVFHWNWEEAFDKWGFLAGEGPVQTYTIQHALIKAGYEVTLKQLGACNIVISSIQIQGVEQIPAGTKVGYVHARMYLPCPIIELLDRKFPSKAPYDAL